MEGNRGGIVAFFTGLSGAGKSTIAYLVRDVLVERHNRSVTLLDGDETREHLSSELGFSREDRNTHVRRIGFVAAEVARHGGIAICAVIAPYAESREHVRALVAPHGHYVEIYVKTPLYVCEQRDVKGHYAKARAGQIKNFTGIDDPYEEPEHPDLVIETVHLSPSEAAEEVYRALMVVCGHG